MKRRLKWKNILLALIILFFISTLIISSVKIITWFIDNHKIDSEIDDINNVIDITEENDNENTEIIKNDSKENDPYWKYINTKLINVNFNELKSINEQVKGWIQVNNTNINYPFVQGNDNDYYLNHSFNKTFNNAGWVFLDYRNNIKNLDKNTIIYAHGRLDKTMFGSLKTILNSDWTSNSDNYIVKLSTEYQNTLWQVFSIYKIPSTSDYIKTTFNNDSEFLEFANMLINRSNFNFNTSINENDKILTLSTCVDTTKRMVLHAKLIKIEKK